MTNDFLAKLPAIEGSGFIERAPLTRALAPTYRRVVLYEAVKYDVGGSESGDRITVPRGFITDYASVPRCMHWLFPPQGRYSGAAIVHDYLYVVQTRTRKESDLIFLEAMSVLGVNWFTRHSMYRAVRAGGWLPWKRRSRKIRQ